MSGAVMWDVAGDGDATVNVAAASSPPDVVMLGISRVTENFAERQGGIGPAAHVTFIRGG